MDYSAVAPDKEPFAVEFGSRVREQRQKKDWSQMKLASEVGLHFTYLSAIERGERNPSLQVVLRIAQTLGVDAAVLVGGLTSAPPDPD